MLNEIIYDSSETKRIPLPSFTFDPILNVLFPSSNSLMKYIQEKFGGIENLPEGYLGEPERVESRPGARLQRVLSPQMMGLTPLQAHLIEINLGAERI